jgi:nickel/cobalt exporter
MVGVLAAWSLRHAEKRFKDFAAIARRLPYFFSALLTLMGLYIGIQGWLHLVGR